METFTPRLLEDTARAFADRTPTGKLVGALVAGSGISLSAPGWEKGPEIPYSEVFPFPVFELPGHTPTVTVWRRGDAGLLVFNGRFHLYQGMAPPRLPRYPGWPAFSVLRRTSRPTPAARWTSPRPPAAWSWSATTSTSRGPAR